VSRDYVYTEWDGVRRFAEHFAEDLEHPAPSDRDDGTDGPGQQP
jgi:hypothetical protein